MLSSRSNMMIDLWNGVEKMRSALIGIVCLGIVGVAAAASAASPELSCTVAMKSLSDDWDAAGFATPSKPGQMRVLGHNGREATGAQVNYMAGQMRLAAKDCSSGDNASALKRIAAVRNKLGVAVATASNPQ